MKDDEYPCVDWQYRWYREWLNSVRCFTSAHGWGYRDYRQPCTLFLSPVEIHGRACSSLCY